MSAGPNADWATPLKLRELGRTALRFKLEPDADQRAKVAADLGLEALPSLTAQLTVRAWRDGAAITGRFDAVVAQLCSVSLEPFEQPLSGEIDVRVVPVGSVNAPEEVSGEIERNPDTPDPPDVLPGEAVDLAAYVVEHLALEIDPFPRKPGVAFEYDAPTAEESPFAALQKLKDRDR
ncbi:MAG: DUF177 domain-containing protein [Phenylobacterium sp.]|nr:MAG: DUF177 domain-containing protein [Phenylobacterium sp.]